jgi:hypothetical protein
LDPLRRTGGTSPTATVDVDDLSKLLPTGVATCLPRTVDLTVRRYENDARSLLAFLAEHGMPTRPT